MASVVTVGTAKRTSSGTESTALARRTERSDLFVGRSARCSNRGGSFALNTPDLAQEAAQHREDVRACGFRVSPAKMTLSDGYGASLR